MLRLGHGNPRYQSRLGDEGVESSPAERDLSVLLGERLDVPRPCVLAARKVTGVLCPAGSHIPWDSL